jgi:hypothetical protein
MRKKKKKRETNLIAHPDDNIRIAATNITYSKVYTTFDTNSEQTQNALH